MIKKLNYSNNINGFNLSPDQLLVNFEALICIRTVIVLILIYVRQRLYVSLHAPVYLAHCLQVIHLWVRFLPQLLSEEVAVFLVVLGH